MSFLIFIWGRGLWNLRDGIWKFLVWIRGDKVVLWLLLEGYDSVVRYLRYNDVRL